MLQKLRTNLIHVADLDAAKEWYSQFLGKPPYFDEPYYVGFDIDGAELGLDPDTSQTMLGTNTYALWSVDDIEAVVAQVLSLNGSTHTPVTEVGGGMKVAVIKDPWQNCIGLIQEQTT